MNTAAKGRFFKWFKFYQIASTAFGLLAVAYLLLLNFPQALFANNVKHGSFDVHSHQPIDENVIRILDRAEEKLKTSPIYDHTFRRRIYLTDSFGSYALLSHKAYRSFANSIPFIDNIIVNKNDPAVDRVYIPRSWNSERSLSGVIAHETAHLFVRRRYGTLAASMMPTWKNEGYCEYIAGESTIPFDEGIRRWKENPDDDTGYRFIKYEAMVKFLLEREQMPIDEFFTNDHEETGVEQRTLESYR